MILENDRKKVIAFRIFFLIVILILIIGFIIYRHNNSNKENDNKLLNEVSSAVSPKEDTIFKIDNIFLYSSANATNNSDTQKDYWNLNIYQYTDISLNINNHVNSDKLTSKNLVKKLYIDNVNFSTKPTLGNPNLFYKNPNSLGIGIVNDLDNQIEDKMDFSIISKNEDVDYKIPSFYADCSNPITLSYVNSNVYSSLILENNSGGITFDGTLLKKSNTLLSNIRVTVDFTIHLINANDEEYICNVSLPINLSDDNSTIYNGHYAKQLSDLDNFKFVRQN
ncbi:MAG: hypothetical protein HFJ43_06165 [Clostridia bacterium]|nr:hypothetical protein [Clostridia bacterium]